MGSRSLSNFNTTKDAVFNNLVGGTKVLKLPVYRNTTSAVAARGNIIYNRTLRSICYYTGSKWICVGGGCTLTSCIKESTDDQGVVIDKPLFLNRHGIGKISLAENIILPSTSTTPVDGSDFVLDFESMGIVGPGGPLLLLQGSPPNIFTAPLVGEYPNPCLVYDLMYVEIILIAVITTFDDNDALFAFFTIDGAPASSPLPIPLIGGGSDFFGTFVMQNILQVTPGQVVNIEFLNDADLDASLSFKSYLTVTILGFEGPSP